MTDRETRAWKRLALSAAGAIVLLTARVLVGRPLLSGGLARNFLGETIDQELDRRVQACETSVQELWRAHNERNGATPEADRLAEA